MAKVTVIVPIYKVEKYLRKCFESLLKQTSRDLVVYAVNDGSPDGCDAIIKEYCQKYPELIKGIKKENGGYGSVLNLAIEQTRTPYFLVCDPDDTLEPDAIATLLNLAEVSGADITVGAKMLMYEDSTLKEYDKSYNQDYVTLKTNTVYNRGTTEFDDLWFINPSPHAKLYKKTVAEKIHFVEHVGYTDNMLFYLSLLNAEKVIYSDKPLANYLINRKGNSVTDMSFAAMNGQIVVFKSILTQAPYQKHAYGMFWYRMFESFKVMLYGTRKLNCTRQEYEMTVDYLESYLSKISQHGQEIMPYYNRFSKARILEKLRDRNLLNPKKEESTYEGVRKRMMQEFDTAHPEKKEDEPA